MSPCTREPVKRKVLGRTSSLIRSGAGNVERKDQPWSWWADKHQPFIHINIVEYIYIYTMFFLLCFCFLGQPVWGGVKTQWTHTWMTSKFYGFLLCDHFEGELISTNRMIFSRHQNWYRNRTMIGYDIVGYHHDNHNDIQYLYFKRNTPKKGRQKHGHSELDSYDINFVFLIICPYIPMICYSHSIRTTHDLWSFSRSSCFWTYQNPRWLELLLMWDPLCHLEMRRGDEGTERAWCIMAGWICDF